MSDAPTIEDVDDVPYCSSHAIDIEPDAAPASTATTATADDLASLEERMNLLLGAQQRETAMVNARLDALSQLDLASTLASAARDTAQAAKLSAEILEGARTAVELMSSDTFIQEQLESHAMHAAHAVKAVVLQAAQEAAMETAAEVKRAMKKR